MMLAFILTLLGAQVTFEGAEIFYQLENSWSETADRFLMIEQVERETNLAQTRADEEAVTCQLFNTVLSVYVNEPCIDRVELSVFDTAGRTAYSSTVTERQTFHDLSSLPRGIYYVSLGYFQTRSVEKIVIY